MEAEMEHQDRLFRLAIESVHVHAVHEWNRGWRVGIGARRGDEEWEQAEKRSYTYLSTPEMADVVCSEWARIFGLE
jgi:hypothetical protein